MSVLLVFFIESCMSPCPIYGPLRSSMLIVASVLATWFIPRGRANSYISVLSPNFIVLFALSYAMM